MATMRVGFSLLSWRGAWLLLSFTTDAFTFPRSQYSLKRARPVCSDSAMPLTSIGLASPRTETRETMERPDSGQVAAIAADAPAILLVAGAGTGKTRVLAARLAHVLRRRTSAAASGAAASNAQLMTLVLSFSSNAAQEICGQASALPGGAAATDARAVWAGTFHSFALRLLGQYPYLGTGLSRFTIADPSDQHAAMQAALAELKPTAGGGASTHKLLRRLSVWKEQGLDERRVAAMLRDRWDGDTSSLGDPSRSSRHAHDDREERLASAVYPVYQRCLRARGKVDFGDLLLCAVRLLQSQPAVLERLHREIGHVLVDEFQDTSPAQYELLRLLVTGFVYGEDPAEEDEEDAAVLGAGNEWNGGGGSPNPWEEKFGYGDMGSSSSSSSSSSSVSGSGGRQIFSPKHVVHLICAADDDQSIYAWRGVNAIQNMRRFTADFKGASVLQLGNTYRLQPPMLQAANSLIARNRGRVTKPPSEVGSGGPAQAFARAQLSQSYNSNANNSPLPPPPSSSSSSSRHGVADLLASSDSTGNVARAPEDIQAAAASSAQLSVENAYNNDDDDCDVHTAPCESLTSVAGNAWNKQKVRQERGSSAIVVQGVYDGTAEASLVASRVEGVLKAAAETAAAFQQASATRTVKAAPTVSVAILVRSAWQFQEFEEQLLLRGVPYKLEGGTSFFAKADLRFPLALMRTLVHPDDDRAFALVASHACGAGIGGATLQELRQGAVEHATTLEQAARSAIADGTIKSARIIASLSLLTERIDKWRHVLASVTAAAAAADALLHEGDSFNSKEDIAVADFALSNDVGVGSAGSSSSSLASALREVFDESGYMSYLEDKRVSNGRSSSKRMLGPRVGADAVDELARAAGEFTDLEAFLRHVALQSGSASVGGSGGSSSSSFWPSSGHNGGLAAPTVRLMTMHRAKGREFTHVFAAGWEEGVFPLNPLALQAGSVTSEAKRSSQGGGERGDSGGGAVAASMQADLDSAGSVEDERRLAYVTLTRAVGEVFLTYALRRRVGSSWYSTQASRFLSELPSEFVTVLAPQNKGAKLRATFGATTLKGPASSSPEALTSTAADKLPLELPFVFPRAAASPREEMSPKEEAKKEQQVTSSAPNPEPWGYSTPTTTTSAKHQPLQQPISSSIKRRRLSSATKAKIAALTVPGLKKELRGYGLKVTGPKAALIERLQDHLRRGPAMTTIGSIPLATPPVKDLQPQSRKQNEPNPQQRQLDKARKKTKSAPFTSSSSSSRLKLAQELPTRTVAQLRLDLKAQGLKVAGNKAVLVRRLLEHASHEDPVEGSLSSSSSSSSLSVPQTPSHARRVTSASVNLKAKAAQIAKLSNLVELKASLRSRSLPVSGSKATLALRLAEAFQREAEVEDQDEQDAVERAAVVKAMSREASSPPPAAFTSSQRGNGAGSPLMHAAETLAELRSQLRARGLPVGGNKATLLDRLRRANAQGPGSVR